MAGKYRPHMDREERAKQFMPFAALKGYEEALRKVEAQSDYKFNHQIIHDTDEVQDPMVDEPSDKA